MKKRHVASGARKFAGVVSATGFFSIVATLAFNSVRANANQSATSNPATTTSSSTSSTTSTTTEDDFNSQNNDYTYTPQTSVTYPTPATTPNTASFQSSSNSGSSSLGSGIVSRGS